MMPGQRTRLSKRCVDFPSRTDTSSFWRPAGSRQPQTCLALLERLTTHDTRHTTHDTRHTTHDVDVTATARATAKQKRLGFYPSCVYQLFRFSVRCSDTVDTNVLCDTTCLCWFFNHTFGLPLLLTHLRVHFDCPKVGNWGHPVGCRSGTAHRIFYVHAARESYRYKGNKSSSR
ncbi:hypothetical protein BDP81DRAFT_46887 [Colletotrichum phormii]|uniref:Uncharacterized protein n=1 Tax=Colletotrichum phormii TaxID=359342 RepID=A0AAJ0EDY2_9PEZI|nr:uncharacterized protein BDP81DRAFT_46887 [Colletotrichum phormii]KAK1635213.1 hypothetical protein BDP81DRAFT_46887 [Colletotrichum phormii]